MERLSTKLKKMSSRQQELQWLAGEGIPSFDLSRIPCEMDVVKLYIFLFDKAQNENRLKKSPNKYDIGKQIALQLVEHRKAVDGNDTVLRPQHAINQHVKRIIERVEKLKISLHRNRKDKSELEKEKLKFQDLVHVIKKPTDAPPPDLQVLDDAPPPSPKRTHDDAFGFTEVISSSILLFQY